MATPVEILKTSGLSYQYPSGAQLRFPDFSCRAGAHLLLTGASGIGKTTLLHLISGLLKLQQGEVVMSGVALSQLSQKELDRLRGKHVGLVFQQPHFVASLSAVENVMSAQLFGLGRTDKRAAIQLLDELGIAQKAKSPTYQLSGGERQRLAIARALASAPSIIFADEPTSSLDDANAEIVYHLLKNEASKNNASLIVVSHDQRLKVYFENRVEL